jgi:hypothetical protein
MFNNPVQGLAEGGLCALKIKSFHIVTIKKPSFYLGLAQHQFCRFTTVKTFQVVTDGLCGFCCLLYKLPFAAETPQDNGPGQGNDISKKLFFGDVPQFLHGFTWQRHNAPGSFITFGIGFSVKI